MYPLQSKSFVSAPPPLEMKKPCMVLYLCYPRKALTWKVSHFHTFSILLCLERNRLKLLLWNLMNATKWKQTVDKREKRKETPPQEIEACCLPLSTSLLEPAKLCTHSPVSGMHAGCLWWWQLIHVFICIYPVPAAEYRTGPPALAADTALANQESCQKQLSINRVCGNNPELFEHARW